MQKRKNIKLLFSLSVVLIAIISLQVLKPKHGNLGVDRKMFQLNPEEEITDVFLSGKGINNHLQFKNGQWYVNDSLKLDQSMRDVFFSVITQVEIKRPVSEQNRDSIAGYLDENGIQTKVSFGDETVLKYLVGGDPDEEISWIMDNDDKIPYEIHLPGYQTYTAGIFMVPANDWRSRFVIDVNFALIKEISLRYPKESDNLTLHSTKDFFAIQEDIEADSTQIADFLDNLAYLQADKFLGVDDISSEYDSLMRNDKVFASIEIEMSYGESTKLIFYQQLKGSPYVLVKVSDGSNCVFDFKRIEGVFIRRGEFYL